MFMFVKSLSKCILIDTDTNFVLNVSVPRFVFEGMLVPVQFAIILGILKNDFVVLLFNCKK